MEKVKVTKEVAEAIEFYGEGASVGWYNAVLLDVAREQMGIGAGATKARILSRHYTMVELAEILIVGYEIEKTSEEKLAESYRHNYIDESPDDECRAFADGIKFTLNTLGIRIKGVDA